MSRQNTDLNYIEVGYFTPEEYYVYIANGSAAMASTASVSVSVTKVVAVDSALSSASTVTTDVTRIRPGDSQQTSSFTQSASATKQTTGASDLSSQFTVSSTATRIITFAADFGSLFSPSITVNAQKAGVALLEVSASISSTPSVNRATSAALENIANLNSQAIKTVDIQSSVTSNFTQSASFGTLKTAQSSLTSTATLTADAINVQLATASMSSTATLSTTRYFGWGRPRNISSNANFAYSNSVYKFGTHSINLTGTVTNGIAYSDGSNQGNLVYGPSESFVAETWIYPSSANYIGIMGVGLNQLANNHAWILWRNNVSPNNLTLDFYDINGNLTTGNVTNPIVNNQWNHILVVKVGQKASVFVNGTRAIALNAANLANEGLRTYDRFRLISNTGTYVDDTSLHLGTDLGYSPDSSTITVPTVRRENSHPYTRMLYRFDNNSDDDTALLQTITETLSAVATITASAQRNRTAASSLAAAATQSTTAVKTVEAQASLSSSASISTTIEKVQVASASLASTVTLSADVIRQQNASINLSSTATVSATATRTQQASAAITSAFSPTLTVIAFKNYTAILDSVATLTASVTTVSVGQASLSTTATMTTAIGKTVRTSLDANVFFGISATGSKFGGQAALLSSTATISATVGLKQIVSASLASAATVTAAVNRTRSFSSSLASTATLAVTSVNVFRNLGDQTLSSAFTVTAAVRRIRLTSSDQTSAFAQSVSAVKTARTSSSQSAAFTQSATVFRRVNPPVQFSSIASQLTVAFYNATGTVLLEPRFTLSTVIGAIKPFSVGVNTGIRKINSGYASISAQNPPSGGLQVTDPGFAISVWARRSNVTGTLQPILGTDVTDSNSGWALALQNDDVYIRSNFDPDEQQIKWNNTAPTDYDWHHYFIWGQPNHINRPSGINRYWHLWVDGQYEGATGFVAEIINGDIDTGSPLKLGEASLRDLEASYAVNGREWSGDIGQVWVGQILSSSFQLNLPIPTTVSTQQSPDITEFYDQGFVDLGSGRGVFNQLPQPVIFSQFESPYTGVTFTNTGSPGWTDATKPALGALKYGPQAHSDLTATVIGVFLFESHVSASVTMSTVAQTNFGSSAALSAQATVVAQINRRVAPSATVTSTATMDVTGVLGLAGGAALFDHSSTLTAVVGYLRSQSATLASTASITADVIVIPPISGDAQLSSTSALTMLGGRRQQATASVTCTATISCAVTVIDPVRAEAQLVSDFGLSAVITRRRPGISIEQGLFTITADATVIPPIRASAELVSDFGLSAVAFRVKRFTVTVSAQATQSTSAVKTARPTAQLAARATVLCLPVTRIGIGATTLACQGFVLTVGDIINFDPALTLMISQETRTLRILPENRQLWVEQETRVYNILKG